MIVRLCCVCEAHLGRLDEPDRPEERFSHGYCERCLAQLEERLDALFPRPGAAAAEEATHGSG